MGKTKVETVAFTMQVGKLLNEILNNPQCSILNIPITVLMNLLNQVSKRASEIDDKEMNKLMCKLGLYVQADPEHEDYVGGEKLQEFYRS